MSKRNKRRSKANKHRRWQHKVLLPEQSAIDAQLIAQHEANSDYRSTLEYLDDRYGSLALVPSDLLTINKPTAKYHAKRRTRTANVGSFAGTDKKTGELVIFSGKSVCKKPRRDNVIDNPFGVVGVGENRKLRLFANQDYGIVYNLANYGFRFRSVTFPVLGKTNAKRQFTPIESWGRMDFWEVGVADFERINFCRDFPEFVTSLPSLSGVSPETTVKQSPLFRSI